MPSPCKVKTGNKEHQAGKEEFSNFSIVPASPPQNNQQNDNPSRAESTSNKSIPGKIISNNNSIEYLSSNNGKKVDNKPINYFRMLISRC
jgi:hypothetical protein